MTVLSITRLSARSRAALFPQAGVESWMSVNRNVTVPEGGRPDMPAP